MPTWLLRERYKYKSNNFNFVSNNSTCRYKKIYTRNCFLNKIELFSSTCVTAFAMSVCLSVYLFVCLCVFPICATQPCWISMYILSLIIYVVCFAYGHAWEIFILSLQPTCQFLVQILQKYIHSQSDTNTCSNKTILFLF